MCGRSLKGATQAMIGDTGVCPKCRTEFVIEPPKRAVNQKKHSAEQKEEDQQGPFEKFFGVGFVTLIMGVVAYLLCRSGRIPLHGLGKALFVGAAFGVGGMVDYYLHKLMHPKK